MADAEMTFDATQSAFNAGYAAGWAAYGDLMIEQLGPDGMVWRPIETAPKDQPVLVYYDHAADPYQDPSDPAKLTPYAAHADGGDFLAGEGVAVAKWCEGWHETEDEYGTGYWMPSAWFAWFNDDYADHAVNALMWMPLPKPPAARKEAA